MAAVMIVVCIFLAMGSRQGPMDSHYAATSGVDAQQVQVAPTTKSDD